jgi:hypothetical protein
MTVGAPEFIRGEERFSAPENNRPKSARFSAGNFLAKASRGFRVSRSNRISKRMTLPSAKAN